MYIVEPIVFSIHVVVCIVFKLLSNESNEKYKVY